MRFTRFKQQFVYINRNVSLLMEALNRKIGIFGEDGGLNVEEKIE